MLCPRPSRIRPRRAVTFLLLLIAAYHLSAFLFSPKQTPSRPSELSGHKGYLRAVDDGMYGYGHRGMVRDGIGDADEDDALDDDVTDEDTVVAEKIAVLRHDPDLLQQPSPSSLEIPPAYVLPEAANSIDGPDTQETPGEPHINERLNPAPRIKEGKKPGGPMESMRKAVVVTGPNAEQARRVRRLIRRYANTWYQRYDWLDAETGGSIRAPWRKDTIAALRDLAGCLEDETCDGEGKVVIASSFFFGGVLYGATGGESIWARSSIDAWKELNYTVLYAQHPLEALHLYNGTSELVVNVLMDPVDLAACYQYQHAHPLLKRELTAVQGAYVTEGEEPSADELRGLGDEDLVPGVKGWVNLVGDEYEPDDAAKGCVKREGLEWGLPLSLVFAWSFWPGDYHPLGPEWTMVPENMGAVIPNSPEYTYLGYSVEKYCLPHFKPHANRTHRAFILGKYAMYLDNPDLCAWSTDHENGTFGYLSKQLDGLGFAGTFQDAGEMTERGVENFGGLSVEGFYELLSNNKVLIGLGWPALSPTPYDALCLGIPFINPIMAWAPEAPDDMTFWMAQHNVLKWERPPYVYNVRANDINGLEKAIRQALDNPIQSYIPKAMTAEANRERHRVVAELDWLGKAESVWRKSKRDGRQLAYPGILL